MLHNQELNSRRMQREAARQEELRQRAQDLHLQNALAALERGSSVGDVLEGLYQRGGVHDFLFSFGSKDLQELENLVRLAAAVRELAHPLPQSGWASQNTLPVNTNQKRQTTMNTKHDNQSQVNVPNRARPVDRPGSAGWSRAPRPRAALLVMVPVLALLLIFALSVASLLWLSWPRGAQAATLMDARGQVEVQGRDGSWSALADGDRVMGGQRLRTGPGARATLVFFEGTRTTLEPGSDVTLTQVDGDWGKVLRVSLTQNAGRTTHSVVPLRGDRSAFTVLTPSGAASVHGTNFDVAVDAQGRSRFGVNTGRVLVSSGAEEVFLTAGQATKAEIDGALEDPAYQFTLQGILTSNEGSTWIVQGVPFTVLQVTSVSGSPEIGSEVSVVGRVLPDGSWVADSIEPVDTKGENEEGNLSSFTGTLESMDGGVWKIAGWTVLVDGSTELDAGLEAGEAVRVTFQLMEDGRWLAVRIEPLDEPQEEQPTEEPTSEATETLAQPVLVFSPQEQEVGVCGSGEVSVVGKLSNSAVGEANDARDLELAAQVVEGAGFVDWVELDPTQIESLPAGGSAGFTLRLALGESWEAAEDGEVTLRVFVLGVDSTRLTVNVENLCEETEEPVSTETPEGTETPAVTDTPTVTVTETVTPTLPVSATETVTPTIAATLPVTPTITVTPVVTTTAVTACTGAQPHPTGMRLAVAYGVPYEEIMGWFCQGFGFGEIEQAYALSWVSGRPVAEIFAMKSSGMGWGEIKKEMGAQGNPKKWATPPPATTAPGGPSVQSTPVPGNPEIQSTPVPPGKPHGKPDKPGKPNKP